MFGVEECGFAVVEARLCAVETKLARGLGDCAILDAYCAAPWDGEAARDWVWRGLANNTLNKLKALTHRVPNGIEDAGCNSRCIADVDLQAGLIV